MDERSAQAAVREWGWRKELVRRYLGDLIQYFPIRPLIILVEGQNVLFVHSGSYL
jgi:hypothetical protein